MRKKRKILSPIAFILTFLLMFQSFTPVAFAADYVPKDVTTLLESSMTAKVSQDGNEIQDGETIDPKKNIKITYSFNVPVIGDFNDPEGKDFVSGGDWAEFPLPVELVLNDIPNTLEYQNETVGNVVFSGNSATVTFAETLNEDEENGSLRNVFVNLEADMKYDFTNASNDGETITISILDKTFYIVVPPKEITASGNKNGVANIKEKVIDWKVKVTADYEGGSKASLEGFTFTDDLSGVGAYIPNSFKIGPYEDKTGVRENLDSTVYDDSSKTLTYLFDEGDGDTAYIFFQTEITDEELNASGEQTYNNTAVISKEGKTDVELNGEAGFTMHWIEKDGTVVDGSEGTTGTYDPTNRRIKWTIKLNQEGAPIKGANVIDTLQAGLSFVSATFAYREPGETDWTSDGSPELTQENQKLTFNLGDKLSGKEGLLTIVAKVDAVAETGKKEKFDNSAILTWIGGPGNGVGSNTASATIGIAGIEKTAREYNISTHKMNWSVTVDTKKQFKDGKLRVLDLLVYGNSFDMDDFPQGFSIGSDLTAITHDDLEKLKPSFNQKYAGNFLTSDSLVPTVHTLAKNGVPIADVLVVTKDGVNGIDHENPNAFSFDTLVTNPDIYAANGGKTITNTASLFTGNFELNFSKDDKDFTSDMLKKDMLSIADAASFEKDGILSSVNGSAAGEAAGFNYNDKSVIFRIHVNNNGLTDATNDVTTVDGEKLDNFVVTDKLPEGWEFKKLRDKDFIIYEKSGNPLKATAEMSDLSFLDSVDVQPSSMTFTFKKLDKPYVILVKAGPTEEKAKEYFSENNTYYPENVAEMTNKHYSDGVKSKSSQKVKIESKILEKTCKSMGSGTVVWTVEYKPYELEQAGEYMEDTLPIGLDLPMDSKGNLVLENNIKLIKLELQANGSYKEGAPIPLTLDNGIISYNSTARVLKFTFPEKDQAYRLAYLTDVTGDTGETLTNKVKILGKNANHVDTSDKYIVTKQDSNATFERGGSLQITKVDQHNVELDGAEFALFTEDGKTEIKRGISKNGGIAKIKAIVPGNYILKEVAPPTNYNISEKTYEISVTNVGGKIVTTIDGEETNKLTVINVLTGTEGSLKIKKQVTGNAGDKNKEFNFTINFENNNSYFQYTKTGAANGTIKNGDTFTLKDGQEMTILGIPKDIIYTVAEADYKTEGYTATVKNNTGAIVADETQVADFTNTKNTSGGGGEVPVPVKGSVTVIKVDTESNKTLSGAVFQLLDRDEKLVSTSGSTGSNGEISFDDLKLDVKYYIKEKTAPNGYEKSDKLYSFILTEEKGERNITIEIENKKTKEEKPKDPEEETPTIVDPNKPPTTGMEIDSPKNPDKDKKDPESLYDIDPNGIPTTGRFENGVPTTSKELDDTPKTGENTLAKNGVIAVTLISGCGLALLALLKRKKFKA